MASFLTNLKKEGYLVSQIIEGEEILHLTTPCRFIIDKTVVESLKQSYKPNEEIGGILWAKPTYQDGENIYLVEKVGYIRNAIEDKPRTDHRNKSNCYLPDLPQREKEFLDVFSQGYLPVTFHTHPIKGDDALAELNRLNFVTETSEQDRRESSLHYLLEGKKLLMPRGLIVGNKISNHNMFIGIYNGLIAPLEFKDSKQEVQQENMERIMDKLSSINLTDAQKLGLLAGIALVAFITIKYPKYSLPLMIGVLASLPLLMTNTDKIENPNYFNKLSRGDADIFIP